MPCASSRGRSTNEQVQRRRQAASSRLARAGPAGRLLVGDDHETFRGTSLGRLHGDVHRGRHRRRTTERAVASNTHAVELSEWRPPRKLMSAARTECVSAPTETNSAPVAAISGRRSSVTPPEISTSGSALGPAHGFALIRHREVVDQHTASAGRQRLVELGEVLDFDFDRQRRACRRRKHGGDATGQPLVVVLDQHAVVEPQPMVGAAAAADGVFLEIAKRRRRLSGIEDRDAARRRVDIASRLGRDAAQSLEKIERRPLGRQQRAGPSDDLGDDRSRLALLAVPAMRAERAGVVTLAERLGGDVESGQHQRALRQEDAAGALVRRDRQPPT